MDSQKIYFDVCEIALTESCNSRCIMCRKHQAPMRPVPLNIPMQRWEFFFSDLTRYTAPGTAVRFFSGESLLHPDFFPVLHIIKKNGFSSGLLSNGLLITKEKAEQIVRHVDAIRISLESNIPVIHDRLRGIPGSFNRSHQALLYLYEMRQKHTSRLSIGVQTVITRINIPYLIDFLLWLEQQPYIDTVGLNILRQPLEAAPDPLWFQKKEHSDIWPENLPQLNAIFDELSRLSDLQLLTKLECSSQALQNVKKYYADPLNGVKHHAPCGYERRICVSDVGEVIFCNYFEPFGDIRTQRLPDIIASARAEAIRTQILECPITSCCFHVSL